MARLELGGTAAAPGRVLGRARVLYPLHFDVAPRRLPAPELAREVQRLERALGSARDELAALSQRVGTALRRELGELLDAHVALLDDPELARELTERIRRQRLSAEAALAAQREHLVQLFAAVEDPYLRSRRDDLEQVLARVFAALRRGEAGGTKPAGGAVVLVAETLAPAELLHAHEQGLVAIVQSAGSPHAHAAILARSLKLPMVVQASEALSALRDGDLVLVDGDQGKVVVKPDALDLARLRAHLAESEQRARRRSRLRRAETLTADARAIGLHVNADGADEIAAARRLGASGVGLYRSEMLFLRGTGVPNEDQQFRAYRDAVLAMGGRPVVLRTLDLGADRASQAGLDMRHEDNPALGLRGIRYSLAHPELLATQIRAMLRASAYGPVRVLLPMLTHPAQVRTTRALIDNCRAELERERIALAEHVPLGGMIETPAAALGAAALLRELDFIAIGSNDLTQYTMAADRNHAALAAIYNPLHPAVLRLIAAAVDAAHRARKPVILCGELAADARALPVVLALGLTELSVHPDSILEVREALLLHSRKALRARRARMLAARNTEEVFATLAL